MMVNIGKYKGWSNNRLKKRLVELEVENIRLKDDAKEHEKIIYNYHRDEK